MIYSDSIEDMLKQVSELALKLNQVKINVKKNSPEFEGGARTLKLKIYGDYEAFVISEALNELVVNIRELLNKKRNSNNFAEYSKLESEAKSILLNTYNAVLEPTQENCNALQRSAKSVSGQCSVFTKIGLILGTIIGLCSFILPGIVLLAVMSENWNDIARSGMAKLAHGVYNSINDTGIPKELAKHELAKEEDQPGNPVEESTLKANNASLPSKGQLYRGLGIFGKASFSSDFSNLPSLSYYRPV